jgi:hypothetical protein
VGAKRIIRAASVKLVDMYAQERGQRDRSH